MRLHDFLSALRFTPGPADEMPPRPRPRSLPLAAGHLFDQDPDSDETVCRCGTTLDGHWHQIAADIVRATVRAAIPEPVPDAVPPPGGVLGYVVAVHGDSRTYLTDADLKTADAAAAEAEAWNRRETWRGRVTVCEVR